jgi:hypothetical protein
MSLEEFKRNCARWRFEGQYHRLASGRDENLLSCEEVSLLKDRMRQRNTTRGYAGSGALVLSCLSRLFFSLSPRFPPAMDVVLL